MNKRIIAAGLSCLLVISTSMPAFAGQWKQDNTGWWWQDDDGSYPTSTWRWLDGNNDGIAESYYFGADGYMLTNTTTPDGYTVNADGAWTVNGIVQTKSAGLNADNVQDISGSGHTTDGQTTPAGGGNQTNTNSQSSTSGNGGSLKVSNTTQELCDMDGDGYLTGLEYEIYKDMEGVKQGDLTAGGNIS